MIERTAAPSVPDASPSSLAAGSTLRVALLSDAAPGRNGVGTYYDDLVEHLRSRVEAVALFSPPPQDLPRGERRPSQAGWGFPMPGDPTQTLFLPSPPAVWRAVREFRPDVIIAATPWAYGLLAIPLARRTGAALCVGYHTQFDKLAGVYWTRGLSRIMRPLLGWWDRLLFRFGNRVLVHNEALVSEALQGGAPEVSLVGTPAPRVFMDRPAPQVPDRVRSVLFVGRLAPEKRVEQVLDAARAMPHLHFRLAGDGPLSEQVGDAAAGQPNLEHLGWVDRGRILELLDASDAVVLPSRFETFGSAAYEGMLRRRAVVVSAGCGLVNWPGLAAGLFVMDEGATLTETLREVEAMEAGERRRVVEAGYGAARSLCERTVAGWVKVLEASARNGGR